MALASPASPSPIVIQMPPLTSAETATTTPKDAGDFATAPTPSGPKATATDKVMSSAANLAQLLPTGTVLAPKDAGDFATAPTPSGPKATATDKVMSSAANLAQLLPTGTVLAYQALAPSFTNHGKCEDTPANRWLTAALVTVLATFSLVFSFTDSVVGPDQKLYYGIATPRGFNVFNFSSEEEKQQWDPSEFRRLRVRLLDYIHAVFTAMVFLTVALSDVGLRNCFFPNAGRNTEELLKNLPLGMAFFSSFVFMIFPTKRKGIGYTDTAPPKKVVT